MEDEKAFLGATENNNDNLETLRVDSVEKILLKLIEYSESKILLGGKYITDVDRSKIIPSLLEKITNTIDNLPSDESKLVMDKLFETTLIQYKQHPEAGHVILDILLQDLYVSPELITKIVLDKAIYDLPFDNYLISDLLGGFIYQLTHGYGPKIYKDFEERIMMTLKDGKIYEISRCFELLYLIYNMTYDTAGFTQLSEKISNTIETIKHDLPDNYFLKKRVSDLEYGFTKKDVHNSAVERKNRTDDIQTGLEEANSAIVSRLDKNQDQTNAEIADKYDYAYMLTPSVRKYIEEDTHVELSWLNERERYYFLQFLKSSSENKVSKAKDFFHNFSLAGIRAFTILDYDQKLGDDILVFGEREPEKAKEFFTHFDTLLDQTGVFVDKLKNVLTSKETIFSQEEIKALTDQFSEAFLRKTKDILIGVMENKNIDINIEDALSAIKGLNSSMFLINEFLSETPSYTSEMLPTPEGQIPQFILTDLIGRKYRLKFNIRSKTEKNAQARVNIEIHFDTDKPNEELQKVFYQETQWLDNPKRKKIQTESTFRMGVDLDETNPIKPGLSLDIGRSAIRSDKRIATGEKLGNVLAKVSNESTHTPYSFDKKFADPEIFAHLANSFSEYLNNRTSSISPTKV